MSRENPAIVWELACAMFRDLSGYRGYPKPVDSPGEHHFIRAFQEAVISVEHAKAVIDSFDQEFPTILRIRESAHKLRPRFESDPLKEKQWEKKYGKPDPNWSRNLLAGSHEQNKLRMLREAIRDAVYYTEGPGKFRLGQIEDWRERKADIAFWNHQMKRMCKDHGPELAAFREELATRGWDDVMKEDWASEAPVVALPPAPEFFKKIEQSDIDRAKAALAVEERAEESGQEMEDRWE
jgi:hypothetical protein